MQHNSRGTKTNDDMAKNVDYDTINISIVEGDTWKQTYSVKKNNVLLDMTGMTLSIDVRHQPG